ncbi:hypothetical protein MKW94_030385 [Papaver nudicaule]|uniref:galactinol--sucrose galactosyltransferase n=1 Tax=Papaver nudicaule TaxID=74823 RepID=A0AA41RKC2_PAPNU|nr:hypothetical protein [Papaver nudicaule]
MASPSLTKATENHIMVADNHQGPFMINLKGSNLMVNDHLILSDVPLNITLTPTSVDNKKGCFLGFKSNDQPKSYLVNSLGKLKNTRFMSIFRFKVWWATHWVGNKGSDLEHETQMMLLENDPDRCRPYVLLLPLIEGSFRGCLQPGKIDDNIDICMESGSSLVTQSEFRTCLYIHVGTNPFVLVKEAMKIVRDHSNTFKLLEEKTLPGIVDKFGWCTWDAFYTKVNPQGVYEGVKGLVEGGCPPGLVLIDDGWQSIIHDDALTDEEGMDRTVAGEQMPARLKTFQENYKFRNYESNKNEKNGVDGKGSGMGAFIKDLKQDFKSIEYVYVWHALCGFWGGIKPNVKGLPESKVVGVTLSPGLKMTMEDQAVDKIVENGVGLVSPEIVHQMYEGLHSYLESAGVDGVKVDVIQILEMLGEEYGGRIELAKAYYSALNDSVRKHFKENSVIASMEHCNDFMFLGTQAISLGRVGDDFWCTDPAGDTSGTFWLQGCHMVHCSYNSLWMGNLILPDWDMFQSTHPCAKFHAASRAISGGPIYVSDSVGEHDFKLLKSLALPDGSILRCEHYALPTRDCLFEYPLLDGKTMLKIWNLNKYTGVLGVFNCQGGGWCPETRKNRFAYEFSTPLKVTIYPTDIEWENGKLPIVIGHVEEFAVYAFQARKLGFLKTTENMEISLDPFTFELLTFSPVIILPKKIVRFAPIGLVNMLNTGGTIQSLRVNQDSIVIGVKGTGEMRVFASEQPKICRIGGQDAAFEYDEEVVMIQVPWPASSSLTLIEYLF